MIATSAFRTSNSRKMKKGTFQMQLLSLWTLQRGLSFMVDQWICSLRKRSERKKRSYHQPVISRQWKEKEAVSAMFVLSQSKCHSKLRLLISLQRFFLQTQPHNTSCLSDFIMDDKRPSAPFRCPHCPSLFYPLVFFPSSSLFLSQCSHLVGCREEVGKDYKLSRIMHWLCGPIELKCNANKRKDVYPRL